MYQNATILAAFLLLYRAAADGIKRAHEKVLRRGAEQTAAVDLPT
jgi:hypothetical protein